MSSGSADAGLMGVMPSVTTRADTGSRPYKDAWQGGDEVGAKDGEHDPRGEEAYVRGYVDVRHAGGHEPHQNYAVPAPPAPDEKQ